MSTAPPPKSNATVRKLLAFMVSLDTALLVAIAILARSFLQDRGQGPSVQALLQNPEIRRAVIAELVSSSKGIYDSHPDPDVARVMQPNLDGVDARGVAVHTNRFGMRERNYQLPKPEGRVRVVLLGDSVVFGNGIEAHQRMGVFLEKYIRLIAVGDAPDVEVLHLGVDSWNAVSEAQFVRRQLGELLPDVVLQIVVGNDVNDTHGVRGWGSMATTAPRFPERCGRVDISHPQLLSPSARVNPLAFGIAGEAQERYRELSRHAARLAREVERHGGKYVLVPHTPINMPIFRRFLQEELEPHQLAFLPTVRNPKLQVSESNKHWNRDGNELVARYLLALIVDRELLPDVQLDPARPPFAHSYASAQKAWEQAADESRDSLDTAKIARNYPILSALDFRDATEEQRDVLLHHAYVGLDPAGNVGPYASLLLNARDARSLELVAQCLDRPEIDGGRVQVSVEGHELGGFELSAGEEIASTFPLPDEVVGREFVNVRITADDWIHGGPERRDCIAFQLRRLALED